MIVIGADLSGPANKKDTVLVAFKEQRDQTLSLFSAIEGASDHDILSCVAQIDPGETIAAGLDAPLSYNIGGGDRAGDSELRGKITAAGMRSGSIMPPTMNRMVYLTLRGISVARLLMAVKKEIHIVEVHPGGAMALRGAPVSDVIGFKKKRECRAALLSWLEAEGLAGIYKKAPSDHYVAACGAALAAWKWHHEQAVWCRPAEPPIHPFDYAC